MTRDWGSFAVILVDVQEAFFEGDDNYKKRFQKGITNLALLARNEKIEIIHLRVGKDGADLVVRYKLDGGPNGIPRDKLNVLPCALDQSVEKVFIKHAFDGFCLPEFSSYLKQKEKKFLIFAGLVTSVCVLFTATSAAQAGYLVAIAEDACGDHSNAHEFVLRNYPFIFEKVKVKEIKGRFRDWTTQIGRLL